MNPILIKKLQEELKKPKVDVLGAKSFLDYFVSGNEKLQKEGQQFLRKTAVLVLAGGSGSRLRFEGPKGCFPISNIKQKSLFELLAEKVKAASELAEEPLEMAIMTSPQNHEETESFFKKKGYFGLFPSQIHFFCQEELPLLTLDGEPFFDEQGNEQVKWAMGPNGNGGAFKSLYLSPIFERWKQKQIEIVSVVPIDNPLANPFDCEFLGLHQAQKHEITIKAINRRHPKEKVGVIIEGPKVVEYGDVNLIEEEKALAYIGLFCVSLDFIEKIWNMELPLHKVKKAVKLCDRMGKVFFPKEPNAWKFELFLFDTFAAAKKVGVISYPRERCFAPLKNLEGEDSILTVKSSLLEADRNIFFELTGNNPPEGVCFELAQKFHFLPKSLSIKWQGCLFPKSDYIEAE